MTAQQIETAAARPLDILGISEAEESAYRWLLAHSGATVPEIAQVLALTSDKTQRLLDLIEAKGLLTRTPERPRRYIPSSPDIALQALALRHQERLQRAQGAIQELQKQAVAARPGGEREQLVELINNREAERQIFEQMQRAAKKTVLTLVRPPVLISRLDVPYEEDQSTQREARARNVLYRSIVDAEFLALPGAIVRVRGDIKVGEEIRMLPSLPFKMILSDRRIALIPLELREEWSPSLLVRSPALLDALYALFEILWERATPISFTHAGELKICSLRSHLPEGTEDLISLMAAGLNDKRIAHEMGISASTLTRRIAEVMKAFNVRNRFQLGRVTDRT